MLMIGPNEMLMIAKERMRSDCQDRYMELEVQRARKEQEQAIRLRKLQALVLGGSSCADQVARWVAWHVLSGRTVDLTRLKQKWENADLALSEEITALTNQGLFELNEAGTMIEGVAGITLKEAPWRVHMWAPVYAHSLEAALAWFRLLDESGVIKGRCPSCHRPMKISMKKGQVSRVHPKFHRSRCLVGLIDRTGKGDSPAPPSNRLVKAFGSV